MKRLIPATLILIFIVSLCFYSHVMVNKLCNKTIEDINNFYNKTISVRQLQEKWQKNKEKISLFVNHGFLDDISVYVGQLAVSDSDIKSPEFETVYKNIKTITHMIKEEQRFAPHSFY